MTSQPDRVSVTDLGDKRRSRGGSEAGSVYQLKVKLLGTRPPVWRRLLVAADIRLSELHTVVQVAMGWHDSHLHSFEVGDERYGPKGMDLPMRDDHATRLGDIAGQGDRLRYEYDFGDSWEHDITVEKVLPRVSVPDCPTCVTGRRACPPEDVGGVSGYDNFVEAMSDPSHPDHDDMVEWYGEDFDPAAFDTEAVNRLLHRLSHRT